MNVGPNLWSQIWAGLTSRPQRVLALILSTVTSGKRGFLCLSVHLGADLFFRRWPSHSPQHQGREIFPLKRERILLTHQVLKTCRPLTPRVDRFTAARGVGSGHHWEQEDPECLENEATNFLGDTDERWKSSLVFTK